MSLLDLIAIIEKLPPDKLAEVEDFVEFLLKKEPPAARKTPKFGSGKGMVIMNPNFDDPIDDFKEYM